MKLGALLVGLFVMISATTAMATGPYISAGTGVSIFHDSDINRDFRASSTAEYDTGYGFNIAAGYDFEPIRTEFEFSYKNAEISTFKTNGLSNTSLGSDVTTISCMINAYYDLKTQSPFTPYIGAGIGFIRGELSDPYWTGWDTVFGYQLITGAAYNINKNFAIDLSYRFQAAASDFSTGGVSVSYMSSNIMAGLRYSF